MSVCVFKGMGRCFTRSGRRRGVASVGGWLFGRRNGSQCFLGKRLVFGGISRELIQIDLVALSLRETSVEGDWKIKLSHIYMHIYIYRERERDF